MPTSTFRLEILWRLFTESIPLFILFGLIRGIARWKKLQSQLFKFKSQAIFFALIGLSASIPLTFTMVQKGFYLVPAFPYFAIAAAILIAPTFAVLLKKINTNLSGKPFLIASSFLLIIVLGFSWMQKGKFSREKSTMHDVYEIGEVVPKFSVLTVPIEMYDEYDFILQGFLVRYFNISLDPFEKHEFFLVEKSMQFDVSEEYKKVDLDLKKYILFRRH